MSKRGGQPKNWLHWLLRRLGKFIARIHISKNRATAMAGNRSSRRRTSPSFLTKMTCWRHLVTRPRSKSGPGWDELEQGELSGVSPQPGNLDSTYEGAYPQMRRCPATRSPLSLLRSLPPAGPPAGRYILKCVREEPAMNRHSSSFSLWGPV